MYLNYFGLAERPFSIAPDPQYLYMSARHREAMAHLSYGLSQGGCFIVLTGEVGTGKTTLCRNLLADLPDNVDAALILNPNINRRELLETVCDELKISYPEGHSKKKLLDSINDHLLATYAENKHTVLIIDEAQLLSPTVLEQVRLLTNLETTKAKLLQIILIGQPELNDVLARNDLRQLSQRVTARYHLPALAKNEIQDYVNFRLEVAGCKKPLFSAQSLKLLHQLSEGIPRKINVLADQALLGAYAKSQLVVDTKTLKLASADVLAKKESTMGFFRGRKSWLALVALLVVANIGAWWFLGPNSMKPELLEHRNSETAPSISSLSESELSEPETYGGDDSSQSLIVDAVQAGDKVDLNDNVASEALVESDASTGAIANQAVTESNTVQTIDLSKLADVDSTSLSPKIESDVAPGSVVFSDDFLDSDSIDETETNLKTDSDAVALVREIVRPAYLQSSAFGRVLEVSPDRTGRVAAFRNLASAWDAELPDVILRPLCEELESSGVGCMSVSNWSTLNRLNRPTIMVLTHKGAEHRVILYRLEGEVASVLVGDQSYQLPISELQDRWAGNALLFWRPSAAGQEFLQLGDKNPALPAVREKLDELLVSQGLEPIGNLKSDFFDSKLAARVTQVQRRFGILSDGKIGPETYLLINETLTPDDVPTLSERNRT